MRQDTATKIRILLLDDHALFREGLSRLLEAEPDLSMVAACADVQSAVDVLASRQVDLVLLDFDLGNESSRDFLERANNAGFKGSILVVTAGVTEAEAVELIQRGVQGIIRKHSPPALLGEIMRKVAAGETWFEPCYLRALVDSALHPHERDPGMRFTERERQVLHGVFEGLTNKELADRLRVSEGAVKGVLQQLFHKTGVRTRSQLVRVALEQHADKL